LLLGTEKIVSSISPPPFFLVVHWTYCSFRHILDREHSQLSAGQLLGCNCQPFGLAAEIGLKQVAHGVAVAEPVAARGVDRPI